MIDGVEFARFVRDEGGILGVFEGGRPQRFSNRHDAFEATVKHRTGRQKLRGVKQETPSQPFPKQSVGREGPAGRVAPMVRTSRSEGREDGICSTSSRLLSHRSGPRIQEAHRSCNRSVTTQGVTFLSVHDTFTPPSSSGTYEPSPRNLVKS